MRTFAVLLISLAVATASATVATAQEADRVVGRQGATLVGFSFTTSTPAQEGATTFCYGNIELGKFLTDRFVLRAGLQGSGTFGGDEDDSLGGSGPGASFSGLAGFLYYFSPGRTGSAYVGADYGLPLTDRSDDDQGLFYGRVGLQGAVTPRAAIFGELGYGRYLRGESQFSDGTDYGIWTTQFGLRLVF